MARIKIKDLPKDMKISADEMKRVKGGITLMTSSLTSPIEMKIETAVYPKIESDLANLNIATTDDKWM